MSTTGYFPGGPHAMVEFWSSLYAGHSPGTIVRREEAPTSIVDVVARGALPA